jgi:glycosyltransferase involved in cell wall biosynthesis
VSGRQFDVSCQYHLNHLVDAVALPRLAKHARLVSFVHDVVPHEIRIGRGPERRLLSATYRHAGELIVFHSTLAERLVAEFDVAPERVHVVPIPIALPDLTAEPSRRNGPLRLLFFGRLRSNKGVEVLCDALELIGPRSDLEVLVAGNGEGALAERVSQTAARLAHVHARLSFIPHAEVASMLADADIVLLPYTSFASQSGVLRDAYARGRPLIVSDVGALGATVRDDGTGAVVQPSDPEGLATAITRIAEDPALASGWRENVIRVRERHAPERVGPLVRDVFEVACHRFA